MLGLLFLAGLLLIWTADAPSCASTSAKATADKEEGRGEVRLRPPNFVSHEPTNSSDLRDRAKIKEAPVNRDKGQAHLRQGYGGQARLRRDFGGQEYWYQLRKACQECFGGIDLKVELNGGVERREFETRDELVPYAGASLSIPLYSREERQKSQEAKGKFLEHGAELIQELELAQATENVLAEQVQVLKQAMLEGGLESIKEFFEIKERLAKARVKAKGAERKLEGWLMSCGSKPD